MKKTTLVERWTCRQLLGNDGDISHGVSLGVGEATSGDDPQAVVGALVLGHPGFDVDAGGSFGGGRWRQRRACPCEAGLHGDLSDVAVADIGEGDRAGRQRATGHRDRVVGDGRVERRLDRRCRGVPGDVGGLEGEQSSA